jgi:hypothetical protein
MIGDKIKVNENSFLLDTPNYPSEFFHSIFEQPLMTINTSRIIIFFYFRE